APTELERDETVHRGTQNADRVDRGVRGEPVARERGGDNTEEAVGFGGELRILRIVPSRGELGAGVAAGMRMRIVAHPAHARLERGVTGEAEDRAGDGPCQLAHTFGSHRSLKVCERGDVLIDARGRDAEPSG